MKNYKNKYLKYKNRYLSEMQSAGANNFNHSKINDLTTCLKDTFQDIEDNYGCYNLILSIGHDNLVRSFLETPNSSTINSRNVYNDISDSFRNRQPTQTVILYFCTEFNIPRLYGYPKEITDDTFTKPDKNNTKQARNKAPIPISYYKKIWSYDGIPIYVIPHYFPLIGSDIFNRLSDPDLVFLLTESVKRESGINKIKVEPHMTGYRFYIMREGEPYFSKTISKKKYDIILKYYRDVPFIHILLSKSINLLNNKCNIHIKNNYHFNTRMSTVSDSEPERYIINNHYDGNKFFCQIPYIYLYIMYLYKHHPDRFSVTMSNNTVNYMDELVKIINKVIYPSISEFSSIDNELGIFQTGTCHRGDILTDLSQV